MTFHQHTPAPDGTEPQDDAATPGGAARRQVPSPGSVQGADPTISPGRLGDGSSADTAGQVDTVGPSETARGGVATAVSGADRRPAVRRDRPDGRRVPARRRPRVPRTVLAWHERGRRARAELADAGMATAEYAIATLAAVGFAGLLVVILKGNEVKGLLLGIIRQALSS